MNFTLVLLCNHDDDYFNSSVKKLVQYYTIPRTKTVGETTSSAVSAASKGASGIPQVEIICFILCLHACALCEVAESQSLW